MPTSGSTYITSSSDSAVTLIAADATARITRISIAIGTVAGQFKIGSYLDWTPCPANGTVEYIFPAERPQMLVQVRRIPSGTDLAGAFGFSS